MKHTPEELLRIIYQYYARGDGRDVVNTAEHRRLVDARLRAGAPPDYNHWRSMLARLKATFPGCETANWSFHLPAGRHDGGYRGEFTRPGADILGFYVSFLVPYYVVYARRDTIDGPDATIALEPHECPYALGIAEEIEASYPGYKVMPPEIGSVSVPDVALGSGSMKAKIYDLVFSEYDRLLVDDEERRERAAFMTAYRAVYPKGIPSSR